MSTILVTGGAGFLGSHIADELSARGHAVRVFDRVPSPWLQAGQQMIVGDVTDADAVRKAVAGSEAVFHLAALADLDAARSRPAETARINIGGTLNLLEACRVEGVKRLLFASTVYVYSREGGFYRCSKQACESYVEEYQRMFGLPFTVLRYGSLYGLRTDASNGIHRYLKQALETGSLRYDGSPDDLRSYIHVTDAAALSVDALKDEFAHQHLVLTGPDAMRMRDVFRMIGEILGRPIQVQYAAADGEPVLKAHYSITPYAYTPKPGRKLTANPHVDIGQGMLQVVERIHEERQQGDAATPDFNPAHIRLVVFDFDGVILESAAIKTEAFPELFADYPQHQAAIREYHLAHQGVSRFRKFEWIYANLLGRPLSEAQSQALSEGFSALVLQKILAAPLVPGVLELLEALHGRLPLAVASGTPGSELHSIVERRGLFRYFADVCGAPHTKPEILSSLMGRHGCSPQQTLIIGDASTDYETARAAGCAFYARITHGTEAEWQARGTAGAADLWPLLHAFQAAGVGA